MLTYLGRFAFRFRWIVIATWVVVFIIGIIFAPKVSTALKAGGYAEEESEAAQGLQVLQRDLGLASVEERLVRKY